jgi:hypothetical protein
MEIQKKSNSWFHTNVLFWGEFSHYGYKKNHFLCKFEKQIKKKWKSIQKNEKEHVHTHARLHANQKLNIVIKPQNV